KSGAINFAFCRSSNASAVPSSSTTHLMVMLASMTSMFTAAHVLHEVEPPRVSVFAVLSASVGRPLTCQRKARRRRSEPDGGFPDARLRWSVRAAPHDASTERSDCRPNYAHAGSRPSGRLHEIIDLNDPTWHRPGQDPR